MTINLRFAAEDVLASAVSSLDPLTTHLSHAGLAVQRGSKGKQGRMRAGSAASLIAILNDSLASMKGHMQSPEDQKIADIQLLEMLLCLVSGPHEAKILAERLMSRFGALGDVVAAPITELSPIVQENSAAVALIKLVQQTSFRMTRAEIKDRPVLNNWDKLIDYLNVTMAFEPVELFRILFLDTRNHLIADEIISRGIVNNVMVYPRDVVKKSLFHEATAIIMVHNHPSGHSQPSEDDIALTKDIHTALGPLSIFLHDHVIVGKGNWFSFRRNGLLKK